MATTATILKGQHKELSDIVSNISPFDTPFQTLIGTGKVKNYLFNWTEEKLADAADNAHAEGAAAGEGDDNLLIERDNFAQIFRKTVELTGTAQATAVAGGVEKLAHQVELRAKELKRDVERAYLGTGQEKSSAAGIRKTAGFHAQVEAEHIVDAAGAPITEDMVRDLLAKLYEAGAEPRVIMTTPRGKVALAKALEVNRQRHMDTDKAVAGVDMYDSDFGAVEIYANRFCREGDILVMDTSLWSEEVLRSYKIEKMAKVGDSDKRLLLVEKGLKCKNRLGNGAFVNVKF